MCKHFLITRFNLYRGENVAGSDIISSVEWLIERFEFFFIICHRLLAR